MPREKKDSVTRVVKGVRIDPEIWYSLKELAARDRIDAIYKPIEEGLIEYLDSKGISVKGRPVKRKVKKI